MALEIDKTLLSRDEIEARVDALAHEIAADFKQLEGDQELDITLIPIMTGSLIFVADLIRKLPFKMRINMITLSSYTGETTSPGSLKWKTPLPKNLGGAHVLLIDDILDSGQTITAVRNAINEQRPAFLRTCVFLRKQLPAALNTPVDYVGFDIEDSFVVGYGLDYDGYYRNLPEVVTLADKP